MLKVCVYEKEYILKPMKPIFMDCVAETSVEPIREGFMMFNAIYSKTAFHGAKVLTSFTKKSGYQGYIGDHEKGYSSFSRNYHLL